MAQEENRLSIEELDQISGGMTAEELYKRYPDIFYSSNLKSNDEKSFFVQVLSRSTGRINAGQKDLIIEIYNTYFKGTGGAS